MKDESSLPPAPSRPQLGYPFELKPELGETLEVAPGVLWIRMSLPFVLNHINLWAIEDGEGWAIVDTGVQSAETTAAWRQIFANGLQNARSLGSLPPICIRITLGWRDGSPGASAADSG